MQRKAIIIWTTIAILGLNVAFFASLNSQAVSTVPPIKALWLETSANLWTVLRDREHIQFFLDKAKETGFNAVIPEAKNSYGYVIYQSQIAPKINDLDLARLKPFKHPAPNSFLKSDFDILATLIEEAHKRQIKVIAAVNVFSEGLSSKKIGPAFNHPVWETILYTGQRKIMTVFNFIGKPIEIEINGLNTFRGDDQLIIYTPDVYQVSPCNEFGIELIIKDNVVSEINDRFVKDNDPSSIPDGGFLISAAGQARQIILEHFKEGTEIKISGLKKVFLRSSERNFLTFVNPSNTEVVDYELSILKELTKNYNIDGIILDRCRYENIFSDFSILPEQEPWYDQISANDGSAFGGKNYPEDIIKLQPTEFWFDFEKGKFFNRWVTWRAKNIKNFVEKAETIVKKEKPAILFMNYVAGWYPIYWNEGVNWAAKGYQPKYAWTDKNWPKMGIADFFDYLIVGVYYPTINSSDWYSIENGIKLAKKITREKTEIMTGISVDLFKDDLSPLSKIFKNHKNIMIFDTSYIEQYNLWKEIKKILKKSK